jgi:hypothetical protein
MAKKYNKVYKDIEIQEENIEWMGDKKEMDVDVVTTVSIDKEEPSA